MIGDLDATLSAWLSTVAPSASISLESPDSLSAGETERAVLTLQLLEVREDQAAGALGWSAQRNEEGRVIGRLPPSRKYRFSYLVSAVATTTDAEHAALGTVLVGLAADEVVPEAHLRGALSDCVGALTVRCAPDRTDGEPRERWTSWHLSGHRTALELEVLAPIPQAAMHDVAAPPSHFELHGSRLDSPVSGAASVPESPRRPVGRIVEP